MTPRFPALPALIALTLGACISPGGVNREDPEEGFGHRYEDWARDGRETLLLDADGDTTRTLVYPAVVDSVAIRPSQGAALAGDAVAVEVLVKGAIPDACSVLDRAEQARAGQFVTVTLTMRQPIDRVCAQVVRPFRFYLILEGGFEPGSYTLTLNGTAHPFRIRETAPPE